MANFELIYPIIIEPEGYYANDPNDTGGETYMGVARNFNRNWAGWVIIDQYKKEHGAIPYNFHIPNTQLDNLVKAKAKEYFNGILGDQIKSDSIAAIAASLYWGTAEGIKQVIQQAAKNLGANISLDNVFGAGTLAAVNSLPQDKLYTEIKRLYIDYFTRLGKKQPKYAAGWLQRAQYVITIADSWAKSNYKPILIGVTLITLYFVLKK